MRAAVIIDSWKLPIFSRHLRAGGFSYDTAHGVTDNTTTLQVETPSAEALAPIVVAAQAECAQQKGKK